MANKIHSATHIPKLMIRTVPRKFLSLKYSQIHIYQAGVEIDSRDIRILKNELINEQGIKTLNRSAFARKDGILRIEIIKGTFLVSFCSCDNRCLEILHIPLQDVRTLIKDYVTLINSYNAAILEGGCSKLEAIDMGRRSLHNEGAEKLATSSKPDFQLEFAVFRQLFAILAALYTT